MNLPDSFFKDELRSDFPVTKKRKQIWATELYMLKKFDQICKKYIYHTLFIMAHFWVLYVIMVLFHGMMILT